MQKVLPFTYSQTASYVRNTVEIRHAWYVEHKSPLGSASDLAIIDALTPRKKAAPATPSAAWTDYDVPTKLPDELASRVSATRDLMAEMYELARA